MKTFIAPFLFLVIPLISFAGYIDLGGKESDKDHKVPVEWGFNPVNGVRTLMLIPGSVIRHIREATEFHQENKSDRARTAAAGRAPKQQCIIANEDKKSPNRLMICIGIHPDCQHLPVEKLHPLIATTLMGGIVPNPNLQVYVIKAKDLPEVINGLRATGLQIAQSGANYVLTEKVATRMTIVKVPAPSFEQDYAAGKLETVDLNGTRRPMTREEVQKMKSSVMYPCNINGIDQACPEPPAPLYPIYTDPIPLTEETGRRRPGEGPYAEPVMVYENEELTPTDSSGPQPQQ